VDEDFTDLGAFGHETILDGMADPMPRLHRHSRIDLQVEIDQVFDAGLPDEQFLHAVGTRHFQPEAEALLPEARRGLRYSQALIPVAAARNTPVLLEAAVRNPTLQLRGIDTLQEFMERQRQAMSGD